MKVTLYAISKNEEKNIEKFINNSKKFFHTVVVDTGSTDNTVQLLRDAGIEVHEHPQTREEFDFAKARNQALSYVKTDWALSLDFNESVENFYPDNLNFISDSLTSIKHLRYDESENGVVSQSNEVYVRLHRTKNYEWVNSVHEMPKFISTKEYPENKEVKSTIGITKKIKKSIDKEIFYLSICEREYEKDKNNSFYLWFIFNHYYAVQNYEKALEYGQEFLNISKSYFNSFRVICFIKCSQILLEFGDTQRGSNYAFHALSESMNMGEEYLEMSFSYLLKLGLTLKEPNIVVFASAFSEKTRYLKERVDAIHHLYITSREEDPYFQRSYIFKEHEN